MLCVDAKKPRRPVSGERLPLLACGLERNDSRGFGLIGKPIAAPLAGLVLEVNNVVAGLAAEEFHAISKSVAAPETSAFHECGRPERSSRAEGSVLRRLCPVRAVT